MEGLGLGLGSRNRPWSPDKQSASLHGPLGYTPHAGMQRTVWGYSSASDVEDSPEKKDIAPSGSGDAHGSGDGGGRGGGDTHGTSSGSDAGTGVGARTAPPAQFSGRPGALPWADERPNDRPATKAEIEGMLRQFEAKLERRLAEVMASVRGIGGFSTT